MGAVRLAKVADGQATKILIPTDLADLSKDVIVKGELFKSGMNEAPISVAYSRNTASKSTSTLSGTSSYKMLQEHQIMQYIQNVKQTGLTVLKFILVQTTKFTTNPWQNLNNYSIQF